MNAVMDATSGTAVSISVSEEDILLDFSYDVGGAEFDDSPTKI